MPSRLLRGIGVMIKYFRPVAYRDRIYIVMLTRVKITGCSCNSYSLCAAREVVTHLAQGTGEGFAITSEIRSYRHGLPATCISGRPGHRAPIRSFRAQRFATVGGPITRFIDFSTKSRIIPFEMARFVGLRCDTVPMPGEPSKKGSAPLAGRIADSR
jgi:hypothetical protein